MQSYFPVPNNIRLNSGHYFIITILNKQELHIIAFNHLPYNDYEDFINLYKKCTANPYSIFLVTDTTPTSDSSLPFRKNLLERISKLIMTIDYKIRDEKLQYDIKRKAKKYQNYHQVKLINMNILQVKKHYLLNKVEL